MTNNFIPRPRWLTWRSALLCAPLLLLIGMAVSSYDALRAHQLRVNSSDRVLGLLTALIAMHAQMQQAESGQRGYLLTGKEPYLTPYYAATEKHDEIFRMIKPFANNIPGGAERFERLRTLTAANLADMQKTIDLYRSKGLPAALEVVETGMAQRTMAQIRTEVNEFVRDTYTVSEAYRDASIKATTRTTLIVILGASAMFLLLVVATVMIEREQLRQRIDAARIRELNQTLEDKVHDRTHALEEANRELEAFCYSVSHDLRAPLRTVEGFAKILERDYKEKPLDARAHDLMRRMSSSTVRMGQLIDDLLNLSRIARGGIVTSWVDLSELARTVAQELANQNPSRHVDVSITPSLAVRGDPRLLTLAMENLFGNAWKFTRTQAHPCVEFGQSQTAEQTTFFVRDNGVGFDMAHSAQLFVPFQRLHSDSEFEGTGIGLATVQRVIQSHGGRIWAESSLGHGATFFFTIQTQRRTAIDQSEANSNGGGQSGRRVTHS